MKNGLGQGFELIKTAFLRFSRRKYLSHNMYIDTNPSVI